MITLRLVVSRKVPRPGYTTLEDESRPVLQLSLLPILVAFAAGCSCVLALDVGRYVSSNNDLLESIIKHTVAGLPTLILACMAITALCLNKWGRGGSEPLGAFVACVAAAGMVITAVMWSVNLYEKTGGLKRDE